MSEKADYKTGFHLGRRHREEGEKSMYKQKQFQTAFIAGYRDGYAPDPPEPKVMAEIFKKGPRSKISKKGAE